MAEPRVCPACGESRFRDRVVLPELTTHTCTACRLILGTIVRTGDAVPEFALVDEERYLRSVGSVRRHQAREIISLLAPHVAPGASILDVGCSFGFFLLEARLAGFEVRGIEPDLQAYAHARAKLGDRIELGELGPDTAAPASADVVCTLDVIEHIPADDHAAFARQVAHTLEPGGIWAIKVPTTEGLYYGLSDLLGRAGLGSRLRTRLWQTRYEFPHLVYFDRANLTTWLSRYGFEVVDHTYVQEVQNATVIDRLTHDRDIGRMRAYLLAPGILGVNMIEAIRRRTDSLVVLARARDG